MTKSAVKCYDNFIQRKVTIMKKISVLMVITMMAISLSACLQNQNNEEVKYNFMSASWPWYETAEELMDVSTYVFVARITDISFVVWDVMTLLPPDEDTEERHRQLHTLYEVEILQTLKGDTSNIVYFWMDGGLQGGRADEQLQIMKEYEVQHHEWRIPVWEDPLGIEVGDVLLIALNEYLYPINMKQAVLSLDEPTSYQGANVAFTVRDIISEFGRSAWETFETQWQEGEFESR